MKHLLILLVFLLPLAAGAQSVDARIAAAVSPLPEEFREGATVAERGAADARLITLREGDGPFICLASDPAGERFHVACYHRSLEPFMARGRELRAEGYQAEVDSIRNAEIEAGDLRMPDHPAALYSLTGPVDAMDVHTGEVTGARHLYVVYVPFATGESTGLPTRPQPNAPWLMNPGTAKAHIMFMPEM
jgi:hypothetical protein